MKQFFKFLFASVLGFFISGFILIFLLIIILFSAAGGSSIFGKKDEVKVKNNSVLHVELDEEIVDRATNSPFDLEFPSMKPKKKLGLNDILENIKKAKTDDRIKGIFLDLSYIPGGVATLEEIRAALINFKESGKWMISYGEIYSQGSYYLASVADEVYLYPEGALDFKGLSREVMFLKGALDKLDIEMQVIRGKNNKFKSAVEPFLYDKMSDANREQTQKFLNSIWNHLLEGISEERDISVEELNILADSLYIQSANDAVLYNLVDKLAYKDEILANLRDKLELNEDDEINFLALNKYTKVKVKGTDQAEKSWRKDKIAVVYAAGEIRSGEGDDEIMGSEKIARAIRKARKDTSVKAIVLRVNSPGGSALASDVMWREVTLAKEEKPLIVSMGDVAASGGYYISCAADHIFANHNTITGSIGVFGYLPNAKKFFNNKLGLTFDVVNTNEYADIGTATRALKQKEFAVIQKSVEDIYDGFLSKVAKGRGLSKAMVDSIGQGRVWSGSDAREIGLIDEFGGLNEAIAYAAEKAGLEDYKVQSLPEQKDPIEQLLSEISGDLQGKILQAAMGDEFKYYQRLKFATGMKGVQARMPFDIIIR